MKKWLRKFKLKFIKNWTNTNKNNNVFGINNATYLKIINRIFEEDEIGLYIVPSASKKGSYYFMEFIINTNSI